MRAGTSRFHSILQDQSGAFQGLGFKFAAGVGEVLAELAVEGKTSIPLDPFAPSRLLG